MQSDVNKRPYLVIWETTRAGANSIRLGAAPVSASRHPLELDTTEANAMIDQVARLQPESFLFTGSDPMARPDMVELIAHASKQGLRVTLSSNATPRLAGADMQALKDAGLQQISLSLDRVSPETFHGVEGAWDCTLTTVKKAHKAGLPVQIHTTFTRQNLGEFDAIVAKLDEIQPKRWSVFQGAPGTMDGADPLTVEEMEELSLKLAQLVQRVPYDIKTTEGHIPSQTRQPQDRTAPEEWAASGVMEGRGFLFISHVGGLRPSSFLPIIAGNVRVCDVPEIYRRCEINQRLRSPAHSLNSECSRTSFPTRADGLANDHPAEVTLGGYPPGRSAVAAKELAPP